MALHSVRLWDQREKAVGGTSARFASLYEAFREDALRLAYLLTRNMPLAEDIVQDAFLRLFRRFGDLRREDTFEAYLRRTVVNLSADHFRRLGRDRLRQQSLELEYEPLVGGEQNPGELLGMLADLRPRQRVAVVLRYVEGLSEAETADAMATSVAAAKSLAARGLKELRRSREENDERPAR